MESYVDRMACDFAEFWFTEEEIAEMMENQAEENILGRVEFDLWIGGDSI